MKTIRFTETREVDFLRGKGKEVFHKGETYEMENDQADRWIRRSAAVEVPAEIVATPAVDPEADFAEALRLAAEAAKLPPAPVDVVTPPVLVTPTTPVPPGKKK